MADELNAKTIAFLVAQEGIEQVELTEAGVLRGRTLTSWPSLQTDIRNAGGSWVDREVCRDGNLVSSRNPGDLPAFTDALVALFADA